MVIVFASDAFCDVEEFGELLVLHFKLYGQVLDFAILVKHFYASLLHSFLELDRVLQKTLSTREPIRAYFSVLNCFFIELKGLGYFGVVAFCTTFC